MKNRFYSLIFLLFLTASATAQSGRIGAHTGVGNWQSGATSFASAEQGRQLVERILNAVGLKANFDIRPAAIDNAAAVVYGGKRYILYNPDFVNNLVKTTGTEWAAISVLAHEIGHHLDGHTVTAAGSQPAAELEADEFSGYVLRRMGASLGQAQAAMKTLASVNASRTHPGQYDRLTAIEKGWSHADDQLAGRPEKPVTPVQPTVEPTTEVVRNNVPARVALDSRNILGDVRFDAAPSSTFYITTRYNLVKVNDAGVSVLGKLARLNSSEYPYLLYDEQNTQLLVDRSGNILTRQGRKVGLLQNHRG